MFWHSNGSRHWAEELREYRSILINMIPSAFLLQKSVTVDEERFPIAHREAVALVNARLGRLRARFQKEKRSRIACVTETREIAGCVDRGVFGSSVLLRYLKKEASNIYTAQKMTSIRMG